jgi:hypothetical protein
LDVSVSPWAAQCKFQAETCSSLTDVDNLDTGAEIRHSCLSITIINIFTLAHKLNLKELPPSDRLALASPNWIASVGKALDGAVFMLADSTKRSKLEIESGRVFTL